MKTLKSILVALLLLPVSLLLLQCEKSDELSIDKISFERRAKPTVEAGNNLSFPVIWSDNTTITIPGTYGMEPILEGKWWYVWGQDPVDPQSIIYSCEPDLDNPGFCLSGVEPGEDAVKAYLQKDPMNIWQAGNLTGTQMPDGGQVDLIDWGDNLESVAWNTKSQIRTEVVLYKTGVTMVEYPMKHVSGWGTDEVHGMATDLEGNVLYDLAPGDIATVFTDNARLTIQKLSVPKSEIGENDLQWVEGVGWTEVDPEMNLINDAIFNYAIWQGGPYSAEVNVKGKIIYGYTWNVRKNNDGGGDYRITFSFDDRNLNTSISNAEIIYLAEEEEITMETVTEASSGPGEGGTAVLVPEENLTYIDITITERNQSKGGGGRGRR